MSTTATTANNPDHKATSSPTFVRTRETLDYAITHVFFPTKLPYPNDYGVHNDIALARQVCDAAHAYSAHVSGISEKSQWNHVVEMLDNSEASFKAGRLNHGRVISQLRRMCVGDTLVFFIRPQNAGLIFTKRENFTLCESFEVSPDRDVVEKTAGSLICTYPRSVVKIPNEVFDEEGFQIELANILSHPNIADGGLSLSPHLQHIVALLTGNLQSICYIPDIPCITKRVRDAVGRPEPKVWRRSPRWLFMRVATQMSLDRSPLGRAVYKRFMLFFICTLARDANDAEVSDHLLHLMACKILRRLSKLALSTPDWLSEMALETVACLQETLDFIPPDVESSQFRNPSQNELAEDTELLLREESREYIQNALATHSDDERVSPTFYPNHHPHGTIEDFLSSDGSFFEQAYDANPEVTLYNVEQSVEQGIDDWIACVTDVDDACVQLEVLIDRYITKSRASYENVPEAASILFLTVIELFVALDKIVVEEVPALADYFPGIPVESIEELLLHKTTSLHRLSCAYQYLLSRRSRSPLRWPELIEDFSEDSFPVRYYNQSPHLQNLHTRIEKEVTQNIFEHDRSSQEREGIYQSPLPSSPANAKVVAFELQCPPCLRVWRSVALRILAGFSESKTSHETDKKEDGLLVLEHSPTLQPYFVGHQRCNILFNIHVAYVRLGGSQSHRIPTLCYVFRDPQENKLTVAQKIGHLEAGISLHSLVDKYRDREVKHTSQTSNNALATQEDCPEDLSLDEFIALEHLSSGGALQWLNILHGLRNRTLNSRRRKVHHLLTEAASRAGPLDLNTGTWIWHRELQEPSFCDALLDELDSLFSDVGAGLIDGVLMSTIAKLLTRILASSPSEGVSKRVIAFLRKVRSRTFSWVEELLYNLAVAPTNEDRADILLDMALTCRSTFDVDTANLSKICRFAEDVDALVSCALLVYTLSNGINVRHERLLEQDRRLSFALEGTLRDVILTDPSDYGVDLAVGKVLTTYQPDVHRWGQLQYPNSRWLTCKVEATAHQRSQTIHVNLLEGQLQVNGHLVGGLPHEIRESEECCEIFRNQGYFLIHSELQGMDFTTLGTASMHKVHFSLQDIGMSRDENIILRAQSRQTGEILQWIPSSMLSGDLPTVLAEDHIPWLNLSDKTIEIRPRKHLWEESAENWKIDCTSEKYRAYKGCETLVGVGSPTYAMVSKCFEDFNEVDTFPPISRYYPSIITVSSINSPGSVPMPMLQLSVALVSFGLSFFVNETGELESREFKYMVYDENQCIGTLFGLRDMLVLRPKTCIAGTTIPEAFIHRRIIVPRRIRRKYHGFIYGLDPSADRKASYHTYDVDTELGCLVVNGNDLTSARYLAILHSVTNDYRPDPLTGKTGIQAAVGLLQQGQGPQRNLDSVGYFGIMNELLQDLERTNYYNFPHRISFPRSAIHHATRRAAHLFSWNAPRGPTMDDHIYDKSNQLTTHASTETGPVTLPCPVQYRFNECAWPITLEQLLSNRQAPELPSRTTLRHVSHTRPLDDLSKLHQLFASLPRTKNTEPLFQQQYISLLENSTKRAREVTTSHELTEKDSQKISVLEKHYAQCRLNYLGAMGILKETLGPVNPLEQAHEQFCQWPPITADYLLRCLSSASPIKISPSWNKCLISLALLLSDVQRARRLLRFTLDGLEEEFSKELENEGCDGWNAEDHPDWLLIQIQGNFLIRRTQAEVAMQMISPQSGQNTVMQVNIGEGKSSVIIPIVAASLADGKQLVRVIVPLALRAQMLELLVARLGGLVNRAIHPLPFSRNPKYNREGEVISLQGDDLQEHMALCMAEHGILLVQPEHVASLKLKSVEEQIHKDKPAGSFPQHQKSIYSQIMDALSLTKLLSEDSFVNNLLRRLHQSHNRRGAARAGSCDGYILHVDGDPDNASKWASLQKWIGSNVRDILDESDEILHSRFQLNYTIGLEQHVEGYPDRWTITQQVLRLVKEHVHTLSRNNPSSMEYECVTPGSFPHIHIMEASDIGRRLVLLVVEDIMAGRLPSFDFQHLSPTLHDAIRSFISDEDVLQVPDTVKAVKEYAEGPNKIRLWDGLLLLRGLLACNILLFALARRRWRVDYGLASRLPDKEDEDSEHPRNPTMLAVPYRAKDMPAPNTQFGHPDIAIILTCLSYYYTGLTEEQLRLTFETLLDQPQDDPFMEYMLWIKEYDGEALPDSLRKLSEINLRSSEQWDNTTFPLFSRNQAVIDFYLSQIVFPKEAKEYPWKLSASSWDLAEKRDKLITGFSGTNDDRWLLPMSIAQREPGQQEGTIARILAYLLQPENDFYMVTHESGERWSTLELLRMVATQQPEIRVLIDVGAQVLDHSNLQVAETWLNIACDAAAAVYFNDNDELAVLGRNGVTRPLSSTPFSQRLAGCIIYLDHAHTRGTDLKLPDGSRAAVTLGTKLTKDALVQGCMRMRKLGRGHTVMFFAPPEVDQSIRSVATKIKDQNAPITTVDILCWAIHETWADIQRRAPYWAQQGMNHKSRHESWSRFCDDEITASQLSDAWLQPDSKSLEALYAPCGTENNSSSVSKLDPGIQQRCKTLGVLSLPSAQLEEEQEREVNREQERERETELPPSATPAEHSLHPDVANFVKTGHIPPLHPNSAFHHVFTTLKRSTAVAVTHEADVWSPFIFATADFCNTIKPESTEGTIDQYLRPVQWILTRNKTDRRDKILILLSPFEVDRLLPDIRASQFVHLHLYAPRTSKRMKPCDDLKLYVIPPLPPDWTPPWALIDQLNVFAGQLYLRDYTAYLRVCHFLGVPTTKFPHDTSMRWNMFDLPGSLEENEIRFSGSPLPSVTMLLAMRNRGRPFADTHMGKILREQLLTETDFEMASQNLSLSTQDTQTVRDATLKNTAALLSDMECDGEDSPGSTSLLRSSTKRGSGTAQTSTGYEPPQKRLRVNQQ